MAFAVQFRLIFVYAKEFSYVIFIGLVIEHNKYFTERLYQHDNEEQYGNNSVQKLAISFVIIGASVEANFNGKIIGIY